jgi:hypothetical protein
VINGETTSQQTARCQASVDRTPCVLNLYDVGIERRETTRAVLKSYCKNITRMRILNPDHGFTISGDTKTKKATLRLGS